MRLWRRRLCAALLLCQAEWRNRLVNSSLPVYPHPPTLAPTRRCRTGCISGRLDEPRAQIWIFVGPQQQDDEKNVKMMSSEGGALRLIIPLSLLPRREMSLIQSRLSPSPSEGWNWWERGLKAKSSLFLKEMSLNVSRGGIFLRRSHHFCSEWVFLL